MKQLFILIILMANQAFAQEEKTQELSTKIDNVTVFMKGAQITRKGEANLKPGRATILLKSLSPYIDAKSIQVKGMGAFTILSVNHSLNYLDELDYDARVDSLMKASKDIEGRIEAHNSRLAVLLEKQSLLNETKSWVMRHHTYRSRNSNRQSISMIKR